MITYLKMKKREWKIKKSIYDAILYTIDNQKDILLVFKKLVIALKDVPTENIREEFISNLAEIIHNDVKK